eukprot:g34130.t1
MFHTLAQAIKCKSWDIMLRLDRMLKDDDIEEGDLPEHKRTSPPIDFSKIDPSNPENLLKATKKGKTLMIFVTVSGNPTEKDTEEITSLWQGSLYNANYDVQRVGEEAIWPTKGDMRGKFFTHRVVGAWNVLPVEVVEAGMIASFEMYLDGYMNGQGAEGYRSLENRRQ